MTRDEILNSRAALKRFTRDYNVPVSTLDAKYFLDQLETVSMHASFYKERFDDFVAELSSYPSAESYFEYYNQVKDSIIKYILDDDEFRKFSTSEFKVPQVIKEELYKPQNHGLNFISIDLKQANFTIVERYCPNLFDGLTWENFMRKFGASDYIARSKYIRQVIFGACNPKKQIQAQTKLMSEIAVKLQLEELPIYSVVTDEILIAVEPGSSICINDVTTTLKHYFPDIISKLKVEYFSLRKNEQGYEKFIARSSDCTTPYSALKCIDSDVYCQVIKYYYNKNISESDLVFDYKGSLARFLSPIQNPFTDERIGG